MPIQKKPITKLELAVISSLSESYTLLPFMIFSSLLAAEASTVNFFVPVVILYSIERACIIGLRGFGEIKNPYRIMKGGIYMALFGAVFMLLSYLYKPLLVPSALLIGVGLSPLRAMFTPLFASLIEEDPSMKKSKGLGLVLYFVIMSVALVLGKSRVPVVPIFFFIYISYILWILLKIDGDRLFDGKKAFDGEKKNPVFFLFSILALLSLLILRQYQASGVSVLMWLTPVAVMVFIVVEIYRHRQYKDYTFQTYWVGGMKSFIMLYSLVYHTSVGNTSMAMMVYLAIALSGFLGSVVGKVMKKSLKGVNLSNLCILLSSLSAFLLTIPSRIVNIIGIIICSIFANIVVSEVGVNYMKDERYVKEERALVKIRLMTAGSVMEQLVLFFTIYFLGEVKIHQNLLEPYAAGVPDPGISILLRLAGIVCSALLLVIALLIILLKGKRKNTT